MLLLQLPGWMEHVKEDSGYRFSLQHSQRTNEFSKIDDRKIRKETHVNVTTIAMGNPALIALCGI